ncbi:MAG: PhoX family phosphatase [Pseudomonadota bacterium]
MTHKKVDSPLDESLVDVDLDERPEAGTPFGRVLGARLKRRNLIKGAAAVGGAVASSSASAVNLAVLAGRNGRVSDSLTFDPIDGVADDRIHVPPGYTDQVVIRWGESLDPNVPDMDWDAISLGALEQPGAAEAQASQFGYNCDAVEYFSLSGSSHGLLCVNHEYTIESLMFPSALTAENSQEFAQAAPEGVRLAIAAHGVSVVEIQRVAGQWEFVRESQYNRRISGFSPIDITGPAAGHDLLQTSDDPSGTRVFGTLNNCAGGRTPWGTYLTAEENFDQYFGNFDAYASGPDADPQVVEFHRRVPLPGGASRRGWEFVERRFDVAQEPNEAFRFGWIVEVDPYNPRSTPKKRTAMGRFKHECATTIQADSGPLVVYSGDDARMEYIFKFVTSGSVSNVREENEDLLDSGTLYAARLNEDGGGEWLALDWATQPVLQDVFADQAEVLIHSRYAADLLGATPMDRPEDVEANPVTKQVYVACTNNTRRTQDAGSRNFQGRELSTLPDIQNPRGPNRWGHIVEITEDGDDNASETFRWEIFMLAGDPRSTEGQFLTSLEDLQLPASQDTTYFAGYDDPTEVASIGSPDNLNFDNFGNLWIVTDGSQPTGTNNGTFAVPTYGPNRGRLRQFMSGPRDCEVCGCEFTPDGQTLFLAIQHPGDGGTLEAPTSYWPRSELLNSDLQDAAPTQPLPSLVAVVRTSRFIPRIGTR